MLLLKSHPHIVGKTFFMSLSWNHLTAMIMLAFNCQQLHQPPFKKSDEMQNAVMITGGSCHYKCILKKINGYILKKCDISWANLVVKWYTKTWLSSWGIAKTSHAEAEHLMTPMCLKWRVWASQAEPPCLFAHLVVLDSTVNNLSSSRKKWLVMNETKKNCEWRLIINYNSFLQIRFLIHCGFLGEKKVSLKAIQSECAVWSTIGICERRGGPPKVTIFPWMCLFFRRYWHW